MTEFKVGDTVRYDVHNGISITGTLTKNPNKIQVYPLQLVLFKGVTKEFTPEGNDVFGDLSHIL